MLTAINYQYEQIELFPKATKAEIQKAKELLEEYEQAIQIRSGFEKESIEDLSETEKASYHKCVRKIKQIERAVRIISDLEVRTITEYRYIKCNTYTETIQEFTKYMDDRTVDRKLKKGIRSVAETLKLF